MTALIVIGCVVLYLAAGYVTAWRGGKLGEEYDEELVGLCVTFWPVVLFGVILYWLLSDLPRKIFDKNRKR